MKEVEKLLDILRKLPKMKQKEFSYILKGTMLYNQIRKESEEN